MIAEVDHIHVYNVIVWGYSIKVTVTYSKKIFQFRIHSYQEHQIIASDDKKAEEEDQHSDCSAGKDTEAKLTATCYQQQSISNTHRY